MSPFICPSCDEELPTETSLRDHRVAEHRYFDYRAPAPKKGAPLRAEPGSALACPKCGGTQFKVQRKLSTKVAFGAASLMGQAKWVRCVTCGERYPRG